jgi:hypothetical protein
MILFFILSALFIVSPVLAGLTSLSVLYIQKKNYSYQVICLFFLSLLLGLINSLKVPESDLINYVSSFEVIAQFNFIQYIIISNKEFGFFALNYILYYLTAGNFASYMIIFTSLSYFILFYSLLKMHRALKLGDSSLLLAIGVAFLFPVLFSLSAHIMRQFLAGSLVCFFLVEYIFYDKKKYFIIIASLLIHTTTFFFLIIFTPLFKRNASLTKILKISFVLLIFVSIISFNTEVFLSLLDGIPVLSYLLNRATNIVNDGQFDYLGLANFALLGFNVLVSYLASFKMGNEQNASSLKRLFFINLFLLLFIIINFNNTEIALRFSFFGFFLLPFSMYFLNSFFKKTYKYLNLTITLFILCFFTLIFIYKLNYGVWTYNNIEKLILYGL